MADDKELWEKNLVTFQLRMTDRLHAGFREYGDTSFGQSMESLVREVEEELIDVANWAFIAHTRLQNSIKKKIKRIQELER